MLFIVFSPASRRKELIMFVEEVKEHLTKNIIPFWRNLHDSEYGGFYGYMDYDLKLDKKAVKGAILNSRILWFFSNAYLTLKEEELLAEAKHAYEFLKNHCIDEKNGGIFWSLNYDGTVDDSTKHTYNQAFAIYALSSYYDASGDKEALKLAYDLYHVVEEKCTDSFGYKEAQSAEFELISNDKLSENGIIADKTMNTLLHVYEGYSELYRVTKDEEVKGHLLDMLKLFSEKVYNPTLRRQEVFFDNEWNSLIDLQSYGHDIETSWLLDHGCRIIGEDDVTEKIGKITSDLAARIYERAYVDHSLMNECENGVDNKMRIWWVQAETLLGFMNQYHKHPEETKYRDAVLDVWNYIKTKLVDHRSGSEWFWQLDKDGNPDSSKPIVEPWKCPYHNGRMCFEVIKRGGDIE